MHSVEFLHTCLDIDNAVLNIETFRVFIIHFCAKDLVDNLKFIMMQNFFETDLFLIIHF